MTLLLGTVELFRRAMWALFRLEWEQILRVARQEHEADLQTKGKGEGESEGGGAHAAGGAGAHAGEAEHDSYASPAGGSSLLAPLLPGGEMHAEEGRLPTPIRSGPSKDERISAALKGNVRRMKSTLFDALPPRPP